MNVHRIELPTHDHPFIGTWHIHAMEKWDASYFNMEVQAFVTVRPDNRGTFQFGLVTGALDGYVDGKPPRQRFAFTWEGSDEMMPFTGSGWLILKRPDELLGFIKLHQGERSRFRARRAG